MPYRTLYISQITTFLRPSNGVERCCAIVDCTFPYIRSVRTYVTKGYRKKTAISRSAKFGARLHVDKGSSPNNFHPKSSTSMTFIFKVKYSEIHWFSIMNLIQIVRHLHLQGKKFRMLLFYCNTKRLDQELYIFHFDYTTYIEKCVSDNNCSSPSFKSWISEFYCFRWIQLGLLNVVVVAIVVSLAFLVICNLRILHWRAEFYLICYLFLDCFVSMSFTTLVSCYSSL